MTHLYLNIATITLIYTILLIMSINIKTTYIISKESIKYWFYANVTLTDTKKITRTSDLFNSYKRFSNITDTNKQDLVLFGKLLKTFIKEEKLPLEYKKQTYAGYNNIKSFI